MVCAINSVFINPLRLTFGHRGSESAYSTWTCDVLVSAFSFRVEHAFVSLRDGAVGCTFLWMSLRHLREEAEFAALEVQQKAFLEREVGEGDGDGDDAMSFSTADDLASSGTLGATTKEEEMANMQQEAKNRALAKDLDRNWSMRQKVYTRMHEKFNQVL